MKSWIASFVTALVGIGFLAQSGPAAAFTVGSGKSATETRALGEFDAIALSGSMKLQVRQGAKEQVTVTADDNLLPFIETVVEPGSNGRTLHIRFKRGESWQSRTPLKLVVDVVKLQALSSAGSGDVSIEALKTPALKLSVAGSSDAVLKALETENLQISIAGSGNVKGAGVAKKLKLSIAGSGDAALADLVADEVSASIAGSGDAQVHATKSLAATVAGSGDVHYRGNPPEIKTSVMGSGRISKL